MKVCVEILSGAGRKTAAAILVTYQASPQARTLRFLLDAGGALEARRSQRLGRNPINLRCYFNFPTITKIT